MYILRIKRYNIMLCLRPLCFVQKKGGMLKETVINIGMSLPFFFTAKT
jgi:hypothetical protein